LQNVLSYVGPGHHLFVALVSSWWKERYATLQHQQLNIRDQHDQEKIITRASQTTLFSSAFATPSRVQLAHECGLECASDKCQRAAGRHADVATLATAHKLGMQFTAATMAGAAQSNKLAEVQYLHSRGCPWALRLLEYAAVSGKFELARWCYEHGCHWDSLAKAPEHAALSGNVELMTWLLQQPGTELSVIVMRFAAFKGHRAMCEYLHSQQSPWDKECTHDAATSGNLVLLQWFMDNGCPWNAVRLCRAAAEGGSVEVLNYLQQLGLLTSTARLTCMLDMTAFCEHLAAAKWLREHGAQWPTEFKYASWRGRVLEWAVAEGFIPPTH
jgi:hypothetical protein